MSIFSRIRDAIFHSKSSTKETSATKTPHPPMASAANKPVPPPPTPSTASTARPQVDVEAVLDVRAATSAQKLNWRTSIVDLMKLLDLDSSFKNRKELADELGYTGDGSDSAAMNVWLHKQVMAKLAESGGKVPESLRH